MTVFRALLSRLSKTWRALPFLLRLGLSIFVSLALVLVAAALALSRSSRSAAPAAFLSTEADSLALGAETPSPSAELPTPSPTASLPVAVQLKAYSTEFDMKLRVLDEQGVAVHGFFFPLLITYPDGSVHHETTDVKGQLYRRDLEAGEYRVSLEPTEGFLLPEELSFQVIGKLAYEAISDVREQTEVLTVTELPREEVEPTPVEAPTVTVVESISTEGLGQQTAAAPEPTLVPTPAPTPEPTVSPTPTPTPEPQGEGEILIVGDEPEPEMIRPDPYYVYSYEVGPGGMLLLSDGSESDILPVEEDGRLYGLRRVVTVLRCDADGITEVDAIPAEPEEGVEYVTEESSEVVVLLHDDGSPVSGYALTATLVVPDPIPVSTPTPTPTPAAVPVPGDGVVVIDVPFGWRDEDDGVCFYDAEGNRITGLKEIDGKLYYFDDNGVKARALGIDVSYFNGPIDWTQVKAYGIDFAIVRLAGRTWGSGILFEDGNSYKMTEDGGRYLQEARAAGLQIGAYVWSSAVNTNEAVEEASLALQILDGMYLDLPLYIDMEYSGDYPYGRADRLSAAQRTEIVQAFCATAVNAGYRPGVYAGQNYWQEAISYSACSGYNIWMASYTNRQRLPTAFPWRFDIWQCSSSARIRGTEGDCDLNVILN